jgi:hypothetical protein
MPSWMPATGPERVLWFAIIALVVGYLAGQYVNRQRSKRLGNWLQAGIGALGGRVAWRWIKSMTSGAEVTVHEARAPYRSLSISYYLLTREFPPLWLWERIRGKRDLLALKADLRLVPGREFEILPFRGKLHKEFDKATADAPYQWTELSGGLAIGGTSSVDRVALERAGEFLKTYGAYVERISLRRRAPHVMAFFRLTGLERTKSDTLWRALSDLVR